MFQALVRSSGHVFNQESATIKGAAARLACNRCQQVISKVGIIQWLKRNPCRPARRDAGRDVAEGVKPAKRAVVRVGRVHLHRSHQLRCTKGIWWCTRCGFYASAGGGKSSVKKLARQCMQPTRAGRQVMERMYKGLTPRADIDWPATRELYVAMATDGGEEPGQEANRRREEEENPGTSDSPSTAEPKQRLEATTRREQGGGCAPADMDDAEEVVQHPRNVRRRTGDEMRERPEANHTKRGAEDGSQEPEPVRRRITGKTSPEEVTWICAGNPPPSSEGSEVIGATKKGEPQARCAAGRAGAHP
jgi:hypothetical protein